MVIVTARRWRTSIRPGTSATMARASVGMAPPARWRFLLTWSAARALGGDQPSADAEMADLDATDPTSSGEEQAGRIGMESLAGEVRGLHFRAEHDDPTVVCSIPACPPARLPEGAR